MICGPKSLVRGCKVTEKSTDEGQWNMKKPVCDRRKFTEVQSTVFPSHCMKVFDGVDL